MKSTSALFVALALGGCGNLDPIAAVEALGETTGDRPSYQERLAFYATNRARMAPKDAGSGWPDYKPVPPLLWSDELAQAARAHSQDMHDTPCFQHPSCDGTDPFKRIQMYWQGSFSSLAENIAAGVNDGQQAVESAWIDEDGASPGETGHRDNIFDKMFRSTHIGLGYVAGGKQYQGYWTQDFAGVSPPPAIPRVAAGSHFPQSTSAGSVITFGAVYYDASGAAPDSVDVVLDDVATPLKLAHGTATAGAWEGGVTVPAGCHRYYFRALVAGKGSIYPDSGTLGVADASTASCPDYVAGGVSADPLVGAGGGGGCSAGGRASPSSLAALALLAVAALVRRRARAS